MERSHPERPLAKCLLILSGCLVKIAHFTNHLGRCGRNNAFGRRCWDRNTRARPWADRLASAWLIKRFIDPKAKLVWLKSPKDCPKRAVGYDFDGAEFTHVGPKVTFEVLLASFSLETDPALQRIGAIIHYLDAGGVPVPEAIGLEAMLRGAKLSLDDDTLVNEAAKLFQFLYEDFSGSA